MVRPLALATALLAVAALAAPPARAGDLYLVVSDTTAAGGPVPVQVRASEAGKALLRAWRIGTPDALLDAGVPLDRGETLAWLDPLHTGTPPAQRALRQAAGLRPALVGDARPLAVGEQEIDLPLDRPGLYLVAVTEGAETAYATALISNLALVVKRSAKGVLAWVVDRTSGRPLPGVTVRVERQGGGWLEATTDADGVAEVGEGFLDGGAVRAASGAEWAFGRLALAGGRARERRVYLHAHQPAYRPGERVELKGIVRAVGEADGTSRLRLDPDVQSVTVRLLGPDHAERASAEVPVSADLGTFSAGFDLAADAPTGDWTAVADVAGRPYQAPLVVEAYRKPLIDVVVTPEDRRLLVGQSSSFEVKARFLSGGTVPDAPVAWQLDLQRFDRDLFPADEMVRLFFGSEREAYRPRTLATGKGRLDAAGRIEVPVQVPPDAPDGVLVCRATVTGPDRLAVSGTGRLATATSPVTVALTSDRHLYGPEDVAAVTVRVEAPAGAAGRKGVLTVGLAPETASGAPPEETWLHTLAFVTDEHGEARLDAPLAGPGRYALSVTVPRTKGEPKGPPAFATLHVWSVGERSSAGAPGTTLEVVADRDTYEVGDVARLYVLPSAGQRPILATLEQDGVLEHRLLLPGEASPVFEEKLGEEDVPNVFATFTAVDHGRLLETTHVVRIPPRTRVLQTTLVPDRKELLPGATSGVTVRVRDSGGQPVENAEVSVAVVDDALFSLYPDPDAPIEAFFHPPRRNGVTTTGMLDWTSVGWVVSEARKPELSEEDGAEPDAGAAPSTAMPAPSTPAPSPEPQGGAGGAFGGPTAPAAPAEEAPEERSLGGVRHARRGPAGKLDAYGAEKAIPVREDFRTAISWTPALRTGKDGTARVDAIHYAQSLTRWRLFAQSVDAGTRVGSGEAFVVTRKVVSTSVSPPRFLRVNDRAMVPVLLRNLTGEALDAGWTVDGDLTGKHAGQEALPAGGTRRVEVPMTATDDLHDAWIQARIETSAGGDAERRTLPVLPQGIPKVEGLVLLARGGDATEEIAYPEHAEPGSVRCRVTVEPAFFQAVTAVLPYLLDYPYGCTEQTMSRVLPDVVAMEAAKSLGLEPKGRLAEAPKMVRAGLDRLTRLQHEDGGFGWWENDRTDAGMTALVVRGLSRLVALEPDPGAARAIRDRAADWLRARGAAATTDPTTRASVLLALAEAGRPVADLLVEGGGAAPAAAVPAAEAMRLRAASLALGSESDEAKRASLARLVDGLAKHLLDERRRDSHGGVSWAGAASEIPDRPTRWQEDDVETTATVLGALVRAKADVDVLEGAATWLLLARQGGDRWQSTRASAAAVEALAALSVSTGDTGAGRTVSLVLDGTTLFSRPLTPEDVTSGASTIEVDPGLLAAGEPHRLTLSSPGAPATAAVSLRYDETGPAIEAADNGFRVTRRYYRVEPSSEEGKVVWTRTPITETVPAGTLVECEVTVETPTARECVMVTSPHPAGFEPAEEVGTEIAGREPATPARKAGYDDRTMFFVTALPAGRAVFRHMLRATHVGSYTAIPAQAELMYFPDVRGSSKGEVWEVSAAGPPGRDATTKEGR